MKKNCLPILAFFFLCIYPSLFAQSEWQSRLARQIAVQIKSLSNKQHDLKGKRLVVMPFVMGGAASDSVPSCLGLEFSGVLENTLLREIPKTNLEIVLLSPKAAEKMKANADIPFGLMEQSNLYTSIANRERPDYYLTGRISSAPDLSLIKISEIKLESNRFAREALPPYALKDLDQKITRAQDRLEAIRCQEQKGMEEFCRNLALQISASGKVKKVQVSPFSFGETETTTPFSNYLVGKLATALTQFGEFEVSTTSFRSFLSGRDKTPYRIRGTYTPVISGKDTLFHVQALVSNAEKGTVLAGAETSLPIGALRKTGFVFWPAPVTKTEKLDSTLRKDTLRNSIKVDLWTNRGNDQISLRKGDRIKFFASSDQACFIRLLYTLADGQSVLLEENMEIKPNEVNAMVEFPREFECTEPFGKETLSMFVSTSRFSPLATEMVDGYAVLKIPSHEAISATRRGLKPVAKKAEKFIQFFTYE